MKKRDTIRSPIICNINLSQLHTVTAKGNCSICWISGFWRVAQLGIGVLMGVVFG